MLSVSNPYTPSLYHSQTRFEGDLDPYPSANLQFHNQIDGDREANRWATSALLMWVPAFPSRCYKIRSNSEVNAGPGLLVDEHVEKKDYARSISDHATKRFFTLLRFVQNDRGGMITPGGMRQNIVGPMKNEQTNPILYRPRSRYPFGRLMVAANFAGIRNWVRPQLRTCLFGREKSLC